MIKDAERLNLEFPACSVPWITINPDAMMMQGKINGKDINVWKKDNELIHSQKAEFTEKEKRVFPIILDQCSQSLRSQLEGATTFHKTCEKIILWNCSNLFELSGASTARTMISIMLFSTVFELCLSIFRRMISQMMII